MANTANIATRLARRVLCAIGRGRIAISDDSGVIQEIQTRFNPLETIDGMPYVQHYGYASRAPTGSDVLALFIGGDRSSGVVVGTNDQKTRPTGLNYGESKQYSALGQYVYLSTTGIVIEAKGLPVTINNASAVTVNCTTTVKVVAPTSVELDTPLLKVTGAIQAGGDITDNAGANASSMASMRTVHNDHTHDIAEVQGGSSTVTSKTPNQTD